MSRQDITVVGWEVSVVSLAVLLRAVFYGGSGFVKGAALAVVRNFYVLLLLPHFLISQLKFRYNGELR